jgi:two-component system response regulator FixJ
MNARAPFHLPAMQRDPAMTEVYVIDDDDAFRGALTRLLRGAGLLVRTYESAAEFLKDAPRLPSGCVIVDLRMPGMDGLELIRRIAASSLPLATVMLSGDANVAVAVEAMKSGATDFVQKPFDGDALLSTVHRALEGLSRVGGADQAPDESCHALLRLTLRERDVRRGLVAGKTNKMIARDLHISPRTVEAHRANLMKKLGAETLSDIVRMSLSAQG